MTTCCYCVQGVLACSAFIESEQGYRQMAEGDFESSLGEVVSEIMQRQARMEAKMDLLFREVLFLREHLDDDFDLEAALSTIQEEITENWESDWQEVRDRHSG